MTDLEAMKIFICCGKICNDCSIIFRDYHEAPCHILNEVGADLKLFANILKRNPLFFEKQIKYNPAAWEQVRKYFSATLK